MSQIQLANPGSRIWALKMCWKSWLVASSITVLSLIERSYILIMDWRDLSIHDTGTLTDVLIDGCSNYTTPKLSVYFILLKYFILVCLSWQILIRARALYSLIGCIFSQNVSTCSHIYYSISFFAIFSYIREFSDFSSGIREISKIFSGIREFWTQSSGKSGNGTPPTPPPPPYIES